MANENYEIIKFSYGDIELDIKVSPKENTVWLSLNDMCVLFKRTKPSISKHIRNILQSEDSDENSVVSHIETVQAKIETTASDGKVYDVDYYSLDVVMEIGKRTRSDITPIFYNWCMETLADLNGENEIQSNIVRYENGNVSLNVNYSPEEKTIWMTQNQIAILYETTQPNVSMHIKNILDESELDLNSVHKNYLYTATDGKQYFVSLYNLDMILAIGYRTRTKKAIEFRSWATKIITEYLFKGYVDNNDSNISKDFVKDITASIVRLDSRVSQLEVNQKHYFLDNIMIQDGQAFEAKVWMNKIIETAQKEIVLIDSYVNINSLDLFKNKKEGVSLYIITSSIKLRLSQVEIDSFNNEYGYLQVKYDERYHDRYLIIDDEVFYDLGNSTNHMGIRFSSVKQIKDIDFIDIIRKRIREVI
ncbi:MAG: virulence RhuM family protein [Bacilli bacterium]|nr:virulence RhuM family protein [Bacilli bacterium]